jgi:hypothetical protein
MGQKSNTLTLRTNLNKNLSFFNQTEELKSFLQAFKYLNFLDKFFSKKKLIVIHKELNFINNRCNLDLVLFYKTVKLTVYKKRISKISNRINSFLFNEKKINGLFTEKFKNLNNNLVLLKVKVVNNQIDDSLLKILYHKTSRFMGVLFLRKFSLFIDFLKICSLFYQKKVFASTFLYILGQIFKVLPKRKHNRFLFFLKYIFQLFVQDVSIKTVLGTNKIKGIKFVINGKLQGKTRASSSCIQIGSVPVQSINKNIEFSKLHVYTIYGAFGFKIWVHRI